MSRDGAKPKVRCAIYTRKSSEEGLELAFNSLDAQREACAAYIDSQRHEGWLALDDRYDDGGYSGGTLERPALQRLIRDIEAGRVDTVVCYKIDRLSRSLTDFARLVDVFERNRVTFVSVTQSFCTTTSMGRLTLNILLSFAQFERELAGERIRDKFAASRRKGIFMGGHPPLGYNVRDRKLVVNPDLPAFSRPRLGAPADPRAERPGPPHQVLDHAGGHLPRGPAVRQGHAVQNPAEPHLPWPGRAQGHELPGRARADRRPRDLGSGA
jgi:DNA invertase Pin-like site-specific DNA recombinase